MDDIKAFAKAVLEMRNRQIEHEIEPTPETAALKVKAEVKVDHCLDMIFPTSGYFTNQREGVYLSVSRDIASRYGKEGPEPS